MAEGLEVAIGGNWIRATLVARTTLTALVPAADIWRNPSLALVSPNYPNIVIWDNTNRTIAGIPPERIWVEARYQVDIEGKDVALNDLDAIAVEVRAALHLATGTVTGGRVYSCVCEDLKSDYGRDGDYSYPKYSWYPVLQVQAT